MPEASQSFPGRTEQYWFFDPNWDQCCDNELHVTYSYYTMLKVGYSNDVTYGGPTGPGTIVTSDVSFESKSARFVLHDNTGVCVCVCVCVQLLFPLFCRSFFFHVCYSHCEAADTMIN